MKKLSSNQKWGLILLVLSVIVYAMNGVGYYFGVSIRTILMGGILNLNALIAGIWLIEKEV